MKIVIISDHEFAFLPVKGLPLIGFTLFSLMKEDIIDVFGKTFFKTNSLKFETYLIKIFHFRSNTHSFYYYKLNGSRGIAFNIPFESDFSKSINS